MTSGGDTAGKARATRTFTGFGGLPLIADVYGASDAPCVLMLPGAGQSRSVWQEAARALAAAGRYVVAIDLRGRGGNGDAPDSLDAFVGDLRAVLADLSSRPVIVGASLGGWIATAALGEGEPDLAAGLVLVDAVPHGDIASVQTPTGLDLETVKIRLESAMSRLKLPLLIVRGEDSKVSSAESVQAIAAAVAGAEVVEVEDAGHLVATEQVEIFNALLLEFLERRVPREPPEYMSGSDSRTLRDALGCFGTGVTVVTTLAEDGEAVGLTANSFTSVSLDPPLLLVCLAKSAASLPAFTAAAAFAVNVLHIGQQPISTRFATKGEDKFAGTTTEAWATGVPIISGSLASFECRRTALHDGGDHVILVGEVVRVRYEPRRDPLLYFRGKYRRLHFA